ncbi:MAG: hypothetical protein LW875_06305 [Proteobacteria bacterium]|jgi:hypothetical protein|nr:hypothetical protein [Pseudomonadota bacterium]
MELETPEISRRHPTPEISERTPTPSRLKKAFEKTSRLEDILEIPTFHRQSGGRKKGWRLIAWNWMAALIDGLILLSFGLGLAALGLTTLRLEWILPASAFLYLCISRVFLGYSLGEWACDLRVGTIEQRLHPKYSLRVVTRMALIFGTGVIVLPLISMLFRRDLVGRLTRTELIEPLNLKSVSQSR